MGRGFRVRDLLQICGRRLVDRKQSIQGLTSPTCLLWIGRQGGGGKANLMTLNEGIPLTITEPQLFTRQYCLQICYVKSRVFLTGSCIINKEVAQHS